MLLFTYGTLMDPDVRAVVLGRDGGAVSAARLSGWRRAPVAGESFPMLVADAAATVDGLLVDLHGETERQRVQFFEGVRQVLGPVTALCAARGPVEALACLSGEGLVAGEGDWDLVRWQALHKPRYLPAAKEYMAGFGVHDVETALRLWSLRAP